MDVDIGSSTVANGVLGLVIGVITTLVVDMAFLVQVYLLIVDQGRLHYILLGLQLIYLSCWQLLYDNFISS